MSNSREIRNQGSAARDHLAGERTFLAWVRTALGVIGLGVVVAKLVSSDGLTAEVIGLALIGFGAVMLVYAIYRFQRVTMLLRRGAFESAYWGPILVAVVGLAVTAGAIVLVIT